MNRILDRDLDWSKERREKGSKRGNCSRDQTCKVARKSESQTSPKCLEESTADIFDISGMLSDTFDMSSVMENIFLEEVEGGTVKKSRKKVSWGDEHEGILVMEKEIA